MITLYHFPLCPFSRKVRIVLKEKNIPYKLVQENPWQKRKEFTAINPVSQTPVMIDNHNTIVDSNAICEYIEEVKTDTKMLSSAAPNIRAEIRRLKYWFDFKFYSDVTRHILNERVVCRLLNKISPSSKNIRAAKNNILYHIDYIEYLVNNRSWLACNKFTIADIAAASHLSVLDYLNDVPWEHSKAVKEWYALIKSRPSFKEILQDRLVGFIPAQYYSDVDF